EAAMEMGMVGVMTCRSRTMLHDDRIWGWGRGAADGWGDGEGSGSGWGWGPGPGPGTEGFDVADLDCLLSDGGGGGDGGGWGSGTGDGDGTGWGDGSGAGYDDTSSRGHRSRAIRRFPPAKKVLDARRPPAPWILLTEDPEPSPATSEEGNGGV